MNRTRWAFGLLALPRAAAFGACLVLGAAQAAPPPIPVKDFVRRDEFARPVLSPDGEHIVLSRRVQIEGRDVTVIVVHHLPDMKLLSTVRLPVFEVPMSYTWLTNRRLAVETGIEEGSIEEPYFTGEIMATDIDGEHQQYLYGYKEGQKHGSYVKGDEGWARITQVPASRNGHLLITEHPWARLTADRANHSMLHDIDGQTAARHLVAEIDKPNFHFIVDPEGKPRFAAGGDDDAFLSVYRLDDADQKWLPLAGTDKANLNPLAMSADGKSFYGSISDGGGPRALVRQSVADGTRVVEARDDTGSIDLVQMTPLPAMPFAAATSVDIPTVRYLDESRIEAKLHKLLAAQFPGDYLAFVNFTDDAQKLLFKVSSDRNPGDYYLFDRKTSKADLLFSASSWLDPDRMARQQPIHFKASDGLELHGYLTLPAVQGDARPPLILLPHGGPHDVADHWFFDTDAQFLASRGYAVLQVNFRGSGGRGEAFQAAGYRRWGSRIQDDLIDGVRWAIDQGTVDPKRICVFGVSFGGYSAMMTTARAPGLFRCAVGYSGLYDLGLSMSRDELVGRVSSKAAMRRFIGDDPVEWRKNSPTNHADKITVPVLLVHGGDDKRTPKDQAYAMRDALTKAGHPPEWMFVDGEGHGFYAEKNRQAFYEKLEAFLAKNLAP